MTFILGTSLRNHAIQSRGVVRSLEIIGEEVSKIDTEVSPTVKTGFWTV